MFFNNALSRQSVLAGRYLLRRILRASPQATVYLAFDQSFNVKRIVKCYSVSLDKQQRAALLVQGRQQMTLDHPALARLVDCGEDCEYGIFWVLEYIPGSSLQDLLEKKGALPPIQALQWAQQIAAACQALAEKGIVHGDIKPENILLNDDAEVPLKLIDCGSLLSVNAASLSSPATVGSPDYLAPAQVRHALLNIQSDIYAFGATLFALLTGSPPFAREYGAATLLAQVYDPIPQLPEPLLYGPEGEQLQQFFQQALAKKVSARYQNWQQVLCALEALLAGSWPTDTASLAESCEAPTQIFHLSSLLPQQPLQVSVSSASLPSVRLQLRRRSPQRHWGIAAVVLICLCLSHQLGLSSEARYGSAIPTLVRLQVLSPPQEAWVWWGNHLLCTQTPCSVLLERHKQYPQSITIRRQGYATREQPISLEAATVIVNGVLNKYR